MHQDQKSRCKLVTSSTKLTSQLHCRHSSDQGTVTGVLFLWQSDQGSVLLSNIREQSCVLFYWLTSGNSHGVLFYWLVFCFTNIREQSQCSVFLINIREQSWRSVSLTSGNSQGVLFSWPTSVTPRNCHSVTLQSDYSVSLTSFKGIVTVVCFTVCHQSAQGKRGIITGVLSKGVIPV